MLIKLKITIIFLLLFLILSNQAAYSFVEKVDGLEYVVRNLDSNVLGNYISSRYNLYEIYLENRSEKAFSIPGYSIDLGVKYTTLQEIASASMASGNKKLAVLNLTAGAASLAFGAVAKSVASTAIRGISLRNKSPGISDDDVILSPVKTYIIYPAEALSLYVLVDNKITQVPSSVKFICHDEDANINYIVINRNLKLLDTSILAEKKVTKDVSAKIESADENVIATPDSDLYK
jgi:hypothetical protein